METEIASLFDSIVNLSDPSLALGAQDRLSCLGEPVAAHCRQVLRNRNASPREVTTAIELLATFENERDPRLIAQYLLHREPKVRRSAVLGLTGHFDVRGIAEVAVEVLRNEQELSNRILLVRLLTKTRLRRYRRALDVLEKNTKVQELKEATPYGALADAINKARTLLIQDA